MMWILRLFHRWRGHREYQYVSAEWRRQREQAERELTEGPMWNWKAITEDAREKRGKA